MIALSFDVEPDFPPHYSSNKGMEGLRKVTELIKEYSGDATFFICAEYLEQNPEVLDVIDGFEVGCHGLSHRDLTKLPEMRLGGEILEAFEIFEEHGVKPRGFRAPGAGINKKVLIELSKYFEYDSSLLFYQKLPKDVDIKEVPLFNGGKLFGVHPSLFNLSLKIPVENKVYFIHPWEYGGLEFDLIEKHRRSLKIFGYNSENYFINLESILKHKPCRVYDLI